MFGWLLSLIHRHLGLVRVRSVRGFVGGFALGRGVLVGLCCSFRIRNTSDLASGRM